MRPSAALAQHRAAVLELVAAHKCANARVFGSTVRGEDKEGSDLDLLVDTLPGATLFDLGGLQCDLEDLLGVPVDISTTGTRGPFETEHQARIRERIFAEARPI